jgi:very-short-patch-repair endonuclease
VAMFALGAAGKPPPPAPPPRGGRDGGGENFTPLRERSSSPRRSGFSERILTAARDHRKHPTAAEAVLWQCLRGKRLGSTRFRRQQPIGPFIVDFYCSEAQLVVEVDGSIHHGREMEDADRQAALESVGLRVIRATNDEVLFSLPVVLKRIEMALKLNSPLPSLGGEGPGVGETRAAMSEVPPPRTEAPRTVAANPLLRSHR